MRENHWAMIEGENVLGVILWDGVTEYNPGDQYQLVDVSADKFDRVSPGWKYIDGEFVEPEPEPQPEPTKEQLISAASLERDRLLSDANSVFVSWQTKLLLNRATDEEKKSLNEWLDYFDALQALDISSAPDIEWPTQPDIPAAGQ